MDIRSVNPMTVGFKKDRVDRPQVSLWRREQAVREGVGVDVLLMCDIVLSRIVCRLVKRGDRRAQVRPMVGRGQQT